MYVLQNGQMIRPGLNAPAPVDPQPVGGGIKTKIHSMVSNLSVRFKQLLLILILLFVVYIFTCGQCKTIMKLFR